MSHTDGWAAWIRRTGPAGPGKRVESRMLEESRHIRLLTRSHPIVLFLDVAALVLAVAYLLDGANPHRVLNVGCVAVVLIRVIRQFRDKQHIPLNIVARAGTVLYAGLAATLILTTASASSDVTVLWTIAAAIAHVGWRYLQWSLDKTVLTHRQLWRIIGVATDDTPSMRFDTYGPTRVRRSTVSKTISGTPLVLAWFTDRARLPSLSGHLRMLSATLEYGDFIADGPSQQDAVLGWVHAVPQPYVFKSYVTDGQTMRSTDQSEATTQPLSPIRLLPNT